MFVALVLCTGLDLGAFKEGFPWEAKISMVDVRGHECGVLCFSVGIRPQSTAQRRYTCSNFVGSILVTSDC